MEKKTENLKKKILNVYIHGSDNAPVTMCCFTFFITNCFLCKDSIFCYICSYVYYWGQIERTKWVIK